MQHQQANWPCCPKTHSPCCMAQYWKPVWPSQRPRYTAHQPPFCVAAGRPRAANPSLQTNHRCCTGVTPVSHTLLCCCGCRPASNYTQYLPYTKCTRTVQPLGCELCGVWAFLTLISWPSWPSHQMYSSFWPRACTRTTIRREACRATTPAQLQAPGRGCG